MTSEEVVFSEIDEGVRCSSWTADQCVDPVGTAGHYAAFLLIDWPLPWRAEIGDVASLEAVAVAAQEMGARVQLLVPHARHEARVTLYRWNSGLGRYSGVHTTFRGRTPDEVALDLLAGRVSGVPADRTEVLVCGHGQRDRCCGRRGAALAIEMDDPHNEAWTVRRTSHLGGHRFAPNALVFPHGTSWAYLDRRSLAAIAGQSDPAERHLHKYRGCTGLDNPAVQAMERAVLAEVGWSLLDRPRSGRLCSDGGVELTAGDAARGFRRWRAVVSTARVVPVPVCGKPIGVARKAEPELTVTDLVELVDDFGRHTDLSLY